MTRWPADLSAEGVLVNHLNLPACAVALAGTTLPHLLHSHAGSVFTKELVSYLGLDVKNVR